LFVNVKAAGYPAAFVLIGAYPDNLYVIVMLREAKHPAGKWEKSLSVGLRFFAALRMTTTLWFTGGSYWYLAMALAGRTGLQHRKDACRGAEQFHRSSHQNLHLLDIGQRKTHFFSALRYLFY